MTSVGTPRSTAAAATLAAGSIPRERIPRAMLCCSRYPSLLATSTTNEPVPRPSRSAAPSTNSFACCTHESEYDEK